MSARRTAPLEITRGDDYVHSVVFTGEAATDANTWTITSKIRSKPTDTDALVSFTVGASTSAGSGADKRTTFPLSLTAAQSRALPLGLLVFDVQRSVSGAVSTMLRGSVHVTEDVTR